MKDDNMSSPHFPIPKTLPVLVVFDGVLLPGSTIRIPITSVKNINLVHSRLTFSNRLASTIIAIVTKEPDKKGQVNKLHSIGTAGVVVQITGTSLPRPRYTLLVTGLCRVRIDSVVQEHPYPVALVSQLNSPTTQVQDYAQLVGLMGEFKEAAQKLIDLLDIPGSEGQKLKNLVSRVPEEQLADLVASLVRATLPERLQILDAVDVPTRVKITLPLLLRHIQKLKDVGEANVDEDNKREGVRVLQRGGRSLPPSHPIPMEKGQNEMAELEARLKAANMPSEANKVAMKEFGRLKRMNPLVPEYPMLRNYLDLLADLPWDITAPETCNITRARQHLDTDHYGLEKVKRRVLEYLAVRQLRGDLKGPILCFVGPPGVGKTSVARSIGTTLGRPYHRISLGGVSDQHDIRGHRRTYIGAMPGRVIQALRTVKVKNPVLLLDEIDKLGSGMQGDPGAALLEVLDPAQNSSFTDTYVNLPFDLSQVLFVATANSLSTIPTPLLDRMEIIPVPGYTQEEKVMIGHLHLLPKQLQEHGLTPEILSMSTETIAIIIGEYTREAGVRTLERKIGAVCRAVAVQVAEALSSQDDVEAASEIKGAADISGKGKDGVETTSEEQITAKQQQQGSVRHERIPYESDDDDEDENDEDEEEEETGHNPSAAATVNLSNFSLSSLRQHLELPIVVEKKMIQDVLGPPIFLSGLAGRVSVPGVAVGLAWTPVGGEVMVVEATCTPGDSGLTLTGQLGSVMKESAKIALSWVRQHAPMLDLEPDFMRDEEIHLHFPAGAISKDGPSAGVTILTVLVSLLSNRCVRPDVAMTGEITLNGVVLPVGGIKEKLLAAHRAGLSTVILPSANKKDLADVPDSVMNEVEVVLVDSVEQVLQAAFDGTFPDMSSEASRTKTLSSKL
ncbi:hypothetical protein Pmani_025635 [Petrolisthes manimaculis]|uniref:Lon protease homolog n=1 Tax=Petrolisthes manimaculis TaxID=1843537 RepID=A0AAE1P7U0_9EUCA|nr:hypothetical protein Pmani_025635 [Petrolisthes manimaculis]